MENDNKNSLEDFLRNAYRPPRQDKEENVLFSRLWAIPNLFAGFAFGRYIDSIEKIGEPRFWEYFVAATLPAALSSLYALVIGKSQEETLVHYPLIVAAALGGMYANPIYNLLLEHMQ